MLFLYYTTQIESTFNHRRPWAVPTSRLPRPALPQRTPSGRLEHIDRKSTRLNSSHGYISYAVFCLKKKNIPFSLISGQRQQYIHVTNPRNSTYIPLTTQYTISSYTKASQSSYLYTMHCSYVRYYR